MKLLTRAVYREIHNMFISKSASILNKSSILFPIRFFSKFYKYYIR